MLKTIFLNFAFLSSVAFGQENVYLHACFTNKSIARSAIKEISFIKNKTDKIKLLRNCIDFYIGSNREQLYTKFLQVKFMGQYKLSSLNNAQPKQCKLELVTVEKSDIKNTKLGISNSAQFLKQKNVKNKTSSMNIYISQGDKGSMIIDQERLTIKCRVTNTGYNLYIESTSPLVSLSTSRFLNFGGSIELGSFIQNINNKKNKLSLSNGVNYNTQKGKKISSITLRAK